MVPVCYQITAPATLGILAIVVNPEGKLMITDITFYTINTSADYKFFLYCDILYIFCKYTSKLALFPLR